MKTIAGKKAELIAEESKEVFGNFYIPLEERFIKKLFSLTESGEFEIEIPDKDGFIMQHACALLHEFMRISVQEKYENISLQWKYERAYIENISSDQKDNRGIKRKI